MSSATRSPRRPLALATALIAALAVSLAVTAPATSAARAYPPGVERGFMGTCVPTAKKSSAGAFTRHQAKVYCRSSFRCLEQRLTLRQFQKVGDAKHGRIARVRDRCTERAAKKALS